MSHGDVRKVDAAAGKLTIKHGPMENLGKDAMTMVFKVKDPAMLSQVKPCDTIDLIADEVAGALTVVKLAKRLRAWREGVSERSYRLADERQG